MHFIACHATNIPTLCALLVSPHDTMSLTAVLQGTRCGVDSSTLCQCQEEHTVRHNSREAYMHIKALVPDIHLGCLCLQALHSVLRC